MHTTNSSEQLSQWKFPVSDLSAQLTGKAALIIDDEVAVCRVTKIYIENSGFTPAYTALNGEEGIRLFLEHQQEIAIVILDMTMPGINGDEVLVQIRAVRDDVYVVLSSGFDEMEAIAQARKDRYVDFIQKPYRRNELLRKIAQLMQQAPSGS